MTGPWEIIYQRNVDGVESLVNLSVSVSDNSFKFEGKIEAPQQRPNEWPLYLPKTVEVEFEFEIKSNSALMLFRSNIPTFEHCLAQTNWQYDNQRLRGSFELKRNVDAVIDTSFAIEFNPFSFFEFALKEKIG